MDDMSLSSGSDDDVSVHVMDAEQARRGRNKKMTHGIRATKQRIKTRQVQYNFGPTGTGNIAPTGTNAVTGTDAPLEEEIAYHEQVYRSDEDGMADTMI